MRGRALLHVVLLAGIGLLVAQLTGCSTGGTPAATPLQPSACIVTDDEPRANVSFALGEPVDPAHAPVPTNATEHTIFRQLYETLVNVDCEGRVVPGLAESWSHDGSGVWQFRLRAGATFWDGEPVTAGDVLQSWSAHGAFRPNMRAVALDARRLHVELDPARADPSWFAHPMFAVVHGAANATWRIGSGAFRADTQEDTRIVRLRTRNGGTRIDFHTGTVDARRALDAGLDGLVSADPAVLDYARALPGYTSTPLTWSRTYALASRAPATTEAPPSETLLALARDAVRGDARAAETGGTCLPQPAAVPDVAAATPAIMYARDDVAARGIAERLVALAWPAARAPEWLRALLPANYATAGVPVARAIERSAFVDSLRTRRALAYVIALPRVTGVSCDNTELANDPVARALLNSGLRVTPLVDTRDHLMHRSGLGRIVVDGDGAIRFTRRAP